MAKDFRSSQIRTNKLITSGSTGTPAKLLVYDISADGTPANQGNINNSVFASSSVGADAFIFVSGSRGSLTSSAGGAVIFGGDIKTSGTFHAINENSDFQAPHTIVSVDNANGGVFVATAQNYNLSSGGSSLGAGIEFSIRNNFPSLDYVPSSSQIVIQNESYGGVFVNSYPFFGGANGGVSIGVGDMLNHQAHQGQVLVYSDAAHISMSAFRDLHLSAGDDELSTIKFYTYANINNPIEFNDSSNQFITESLANRTIIGAINELKVSASFATGSSGGGGDPVWIDSGNYIYNTASMIGASQQSTSTITNGAFASVILGSARSNIVDFGGIYPTSSFIIGSTRSFVSGTNRSGIIGSEFSSISADGDNNAIFSSNFCSMDDPDFYGLTQTVFIASDTAEIHGGYDTAMIASSISTISQSSFSAIIASSDSAIDCQFGGNANTIIGGFQSRIRTDGVGYSTVIGPGIRNHQSYQMHIGYGGFATYGTAPLVVISGSTHFTSGSGATFFNGLSGSLTRLSNGASYLVAGTGVTITSASNGSVTISATGGGGSSLVVASGSNGQIVTSSVDFINFTGPGIESVNISGSGVTVTVTTGSGGSVGGGGSFPTRATVGNYSVVTQSSPQTVGGNYIVASEHQSGSIELRTILSTTNTANRAHVRLFSITDGYYLPIGGAGIFELNTISSTPTVLTSSNLNAIITSSILLEVQVSGTLGAGSLVITHHNSDIIFSE